MLFMLVTHGYMTPVMYVDPSGEFALSILIGSIIVGAILGVATAAYFDYKDDDRIFNGSITIAQYIGASFIGAGVGGLLGYMLPTVVGSLTTGGFGLGGSLVTSSGMVMSTGITIGSISALGITYMFSTKRMGPGRHSSNRSENQFIDYMQQKYKFDKVIRRKIHDEISGMRYSKKIIEEIIKAILGIK